MEGMHTLTTHGIKISVDAHYQALHSVPERDKYLHVYHIRIDNKNTFPVKLLTRHWEITEANGRKTTVDGEGVIGEQPEIEAGGFHVYSSYSVLSTVIGRMMGHYTMKRADTQELIQAGIPAFTLEYPPILN